MRLLVDENLPIMIAKQAKDLGIEASWVRDEMPGAPDREILDRLRVTGETLVTRDIRFANHVLEQIVAGSALRGVILIREQNLADLKTAWVRYLQQPREERGIAVVTKNGIRFRRAESTKPEP